MKFDYSNNCWMHSSARGTLERVLDWSLIAFALAAAGYVAYLWVETWGIL